MDSREALRVDISQGGRPTHYPGTNVEPWEMSTLKGQKEGENPVKGAEGKDLKEY